MFLSLHNLVLFFQLVPTTLSSNALILRHLLTLNFHEIYFLDSSWERAYDAHFFFFLAWFISHSMMISSSIHYATSHIILIAETLYHVYIAQFLCPFMSWWVPELFALSGYCNSGLVNEEWQADFIALAMHSKVEAVWF